jgi:hypothetical protein
MYCNIFQGIVMYCNIFQGIVMYCNIFQGIIKHFQKITITLKTPY